MEYLCKIIPFFRRNTMRPKEEGMSTNENKKEDKYVSLFLPFFYYYHTLPVLPLECSIPASIITLSFHTQK